MSWRGLILFTSIVSLFSLAYSVSRVEASPLALALFRLAPPLGAALWVEADARNFRRVPCYEFGAFVRFGWPVAVPWYCFWSRGRPGWRAALALIGLVEVLLVPVLLGGGVPLLERGAPLTQHAHEQVERYPSGLLSLRYRVPDAAAV